MRQMLVHLGGRCARYYNFREKDGLFRLKLFFVVIFLLPISGCESISHMRKCDASASPAFASLRETYPHNEDRGVGTEAAPVGQICTIEHGKFLAWWSLVVALGFTWVMACLQYWIFAGRDQRAFTSTKNEGLVGLATIALLTAWAFLLAQGNGSFIMKPIEIPVVKLIFPSIKNFLVASVAFIFWYVDKNEPEFLREAPTDCAVFFSVVLTSMFVGMGQGALGYYFVNAFNAGLVAFHLILGTLLFEGRFQSSAVSSVPVGVNPRLNRIG